MASTKKSKATVSSIKFTSRISMKVGETFYTVEACEERLLPEGLTDSEIKNERALLWETVNAEVDKQGDDILDEYTKNRKKPLH